MKMKRLIIRFGRRVRKVYRRVLKFIGIIKSPPTKKMCRRHLKVFLSTRFSNEEAYIIVSAPVPVKRNPEAPFIDFIKWYYTKKSPHFTFYGDTKNLMLKREKICGWNLSKEDV